MQPKSIFHFVFVSLFAGSAISGCQTTKQFEKPFTSQDEAGKEPGGFVFLEGPSGVRQTGRTLEWKASKKWSVQGYYLLDGRKIPDSDTVDLRKQTATRYTAKYRLRSGSYMEVIRIRRGKINLYYHEGEDAAIAGPGGSMQGDVRGAYHMFFYDKPGGSPKFLEKDDFANAISDNKAALDLFEKHFPGKRIPKRADKANLAHLTEVVDLYNRG